MISFKRVLLFFIYAATTVSFLSASEQATKDRMKTDIDSIKNMLEASYAPSEWKASHFQWDLAYEVQKAKDSVEMAEGITTKKFQEILRDFFHSTKDYHVGIYFYSTEKSSLPFKVQPLSGRYYVSSVLDPFNLVQNHGLSVGDEVVRFDGRPIASVIKELIATQTPNANPDTDEELASQSLTQRNGMLGHAVPKGNIKVVVRSQATGKEKTVNLTWEYTPEKIGNGFEVVKHAARIGAPADNDLLSAWVNPKRRFTKTMMLPQYAMLKKLQPKKVSADEEDGDDGEKMGARNSELPPLGKVIWQSSSDSTFQAYIFETPAHKFVGFVRIPTYNTGDGLDNFMSGQDPVTDMVAIIRHFEEATDALVIDQMNNPGGDLLYMYDLLSILTDKPLDLPRQRIMINQEDVFEALEFIDLVSLLNEYKDFIDLDQETLDFLNNASPYYDFIISQWEQGKYFTDLCYLLGVEQIKPHAEAHYSKPILLLVNSLDFSCGDFFPAIMQDNKRAILMGTRTAGAGGYVKQHSFTNRQGIASFSFTGSLAERLNGLPIENLGVTPDIECKPTLNDILRGYPDYAKKINQQLNKMLR